MNMFHCVALVLLITSVPGAWGQDNKPLVRVAVVGLSHDHAYGFFPRLRDRSDVSLVGVVETNRALIETYTRRFNLSSNLFLPAWTICSRCRSM